MDMAKSRILVVEDDPDIRAALCAILAEDGYSVSSAADGREALAALRAGPLPRVILLDLMMPVMAGPAFRAAQLADPALGAIPVIVLSAEPHIHEEAREMGAAASFAKPFELQQLLRVLTRLVGGEL